MVQWGMYNWQWSLYLTAVALGVFDLEENQDRPNLYEFQGRHRLDN